MSDGPGHTIGEILAEALGPPVDKDSMLFKLRLGSVMDNDISPKQARALLAKSRKKPTKKLPPEVTLENLGLSIEALRYQLQGMDDDATGLIETASKIRVALADFDSQSPPNTQNRVRLNRVIGDLDELARAVVTIRGWLEHMVAISGYRGGVDPNYQARRIALLAAEEYLARTGKAPSMPNFSAGPQGSPYSRLLGKLFERVGLGEGSIWNAGKWAVDEMAKKD